MPLDLAKTEDMRALLRGGTASAPAAVPAPPTPDAVLYDAAGTADVTAARSALDRGAKVLVVRTLARPLCRG